MPPKSDFVEYDLVVSLVESIMKNTDGGEKRGSSDPFWPKAERLFLQAIFIFTIDGFPPEERNMVTALNLISMLEIGEDDDMQSDLDFFVKIFARIFGENHIGVQQYNEFRSKASGKTAKSIAISAVSRLAPYRSCSIRTLFPHINGEQVFLEEWKRNIEDNKFI